MFSHLTTLVCCLTCRRLAICKFIVFFLIVAYFSFFNTSLSRFSAHNCPRPSHSHASWRVLSSCCPLPLWARNVYSKPPWTLCALWEIKVPSELLVYHLTEWVRSLSHRVTQKNRTHGVSQRPCGRQIAQNVTPIFGSNALWTLYAEGVLCARNCAPKNSVNSVCSVREKASNEQTHALKRFC